MVIGMDTTAPKIKHLLSVESLDKASVNYLLDKTDYFLAEFLNNNATLDTLRGIIVANLFFEPSTRTRISFEIAAKRLGAIILNPHMETSALKKGESLIDTIHTFEEMGTEMFIVRHADNNTAHFIASELRHDACVINGGDGYNQHPTQALIDLYTIRQHKPDFKDLIVTVVGDIAHSRVARSLIEALKLMGTETIRLVAPKELVPNDSDRIGVEVCSTLDEGLVDADVIMALRIQKERMEESDIPDTKKFFNRYGLTTKNLRLAKNDAIVMHPGPLNRGVEIESAVADGPQSVILEQVRYGAAVRMAVMDTLFKSK